MKDIIFGMFVMCMICVLITMFIGIGLAEVGIWLNK